VRGRPVIRFLLAAIPIGALSIAVPFINRVDPRIFGLPFVLAWIAGWVLITPAFLWTIGRLERRW
jgi:Protein of unknown function (DUF3311)